MHIKLTLLFICYLLSYPSVAQSLDGLKLDIAKSFHTNEIDSISKVMKLKPGDQVKVFAIFKVSENGELFDIQARGPHPVFEKAVIKALEKISPLDLKIENEQSFALPVIYIIETDAEKKRRIRRERKNLGYFPLRNP